MLVIPEYDPVWPGNSSHGTIEAIKVKTFGQVDQRSLQQLERCMRAGDAEFGVLENRSR
jgi:hypothetical protein